MKANQIILLLVATMLLWSCGGNDDSSEPTEPPQSMLKKKEEVDPMTTKGVGPISSIKLDELDQTLAETGQELFDAKCTACHKTDKRFIGPAMVGVTERRTPEWIMNMILNPEGMVKEDPVAKQLLIEYNGSPMANQSLTEDEARSILEYFRTL